MSNYKDDNKMVKFGKLFYKGKPIGMSNNVHLFVDPAEVGEDTTVTITKHCTPGPSEYDHSDWGPSSLEGLLVAYNHTAQANWEHKSPEDINNDLVSAVKRMRDCTRKILIIAELNPFLQMAKQAAKGFKDFPTLKVVAPSFVKELNMKNQGLDLTLQCRDDLDILRDNVLLIKGKMLKEEKTLISKLATEEPMDVNIKGRRPKWLN